MSHSNIICLVALLSLFTVLQAYPSNSYYRPRAQQVRMRQQRPIQFNRPRSEFMELREQLESQSHEDEFPKRRLQQFNSESRLHPQNQALLQQMQSLVNDSMVVTQDLSIQNCGPVGNLVQSVINSALGFVFLIWPSAVQIDIDCDVYNTGECVAVTVQAPVGTVQADVDVCVRSSGDVCVAVYSQTTTTCNAAPIDVNIPLNGGTFPIRIKVDIFTPCVSVEVNRPAC